MTPDDALIELFDRVAALQGTGALFTTDELAQWPGAAVAALKALKLIAKARPASSAICPGCERECVMPVYTRSHPTGSAAFIVCDKRSDVNRVDIPITQIEQWQASGDSIANLLADLLGLRRPSVADTSSGRWEIGLFKGAKHASHLELLVGDKLTLKLAGHMITLAEVLALEGGTLKVDKRRLSRLVDQPVAGGGDIESAVQRRARIRNRVNELKAKGVKAFLRTVAKEEDISVTRVKQLLKEELEPTEVPIKW